MRYMEGGTVKIKQRELFDETVRNGDVVLNAATLRRHFDGKNYFLTQDRSVSEGNWTDFLSLQISFHEAAT